MERKNVEIKDKWLLTIEEASFYFNIGQTTLREMLKDETCPFCLRVKSKYLIKRVVLEKWLLQQYSI